MNYQDNLTVSFSLCWHFPPFGLNYQLRDLLSELVSDVLVKIIIIFQRASPSTAHSFSSKGLSATFSTKEQDFCGKSSWDFGKRSDLSEEELLLLYRKLLLVRSLTINNLWAFWPPVHFNQVPMHQLLFPAHWEHAHLQSNSHAPAKCTGYRKLHFSCVETHVLALTVVQSFDLSVQGLRIINQSNLFFNKLVRKKKLLS